VFFKISVLGGLKGAAAWQPSHLPVCAREQKYWIRHVFRASEEEGEFHILFGHLKDDRQKCFKYFRISILKFENFEQLLPTDKRTHDGDVA
jgi:hypothetical protein